MRQRLLQRDLAAAAPGAVAGRPAAEVERRVGTMSSGAAPASSAARKTKGLKARAGLAAGLGGAVELAGAVVAAAGHGADRAGRGLHHHHRALGDAGPRAGAGEQRLQPRLHHRLQPGRAWCAASGRRCRGRLGQILQRPVGEPAGLAATGRGRSASASASAPLRLR